MAVASSGDALVGPSLAQIGRTGTGSLVIDDGSALTVTTNPALSFGYNAVEIGISSGSRGLVTVDGPGSALTATGGAGNINVGRAGEGQLALTNGAEANGFFIVVGRSAGSDGLLQVDGPGTVLTASDAFGNFTTYTGYAGFLRAGRDAGSYGRIEITNGGTVNVQNDPQSTYDVPVFSLGRNYGSTGVLLVDGPGSVLNLFQTGPSDDAPVIGDMPTADNLFNGPYLSLGYRGGSGFATVQNGGAISVVGEDAALEIGQQAIGGTGENVLEIRSGGTVSVTSEGNRVGARVSIGREEQTTGLLVIEGAGSRLDVVSDQLPGFEENRSSQLFVGERGRGELLLTDGAVLAVDGADDAFPVVAIGLGSPGGTGAEGLALVTGEGTSLVLEGTAGLGAGVGAAGILTVGAYSGSAGQLRIEDGARVETTGQNSAVAIANAAGSSGLVTVMGEGSLLATGSTLLIGAEGTLGSGAIDPATGGTGALEIRQGAEARADTVVVGDSGRLLGNGTLGGDLTLSGLLEVAGEGTGRLLVDGAVSLSPGATLSLDLADLETGRRDRIDVTGDADFALDAITVDLRLPEIPTDLRGLSLAVAEAEGALSPGAQLLPASDGARVALETRGDSLMLDIFRPTMLGAAVPEALSGTDGADTILALGGDDTLTATPGDDVLHGGLGDDLLRYDLARSDVTLSLGAALAAEIGGLGQDELFGIERVAFTDGVLFLDVENAALTATFRLFVAALGRTPDAGGLQFWQEAVEGALGLNGVADAFVLSAEFAAIFGAAPEPEALVTAFFENVLDRAPDAAGLGFWTEQVESGALDTVSLLLAFSESPENVERSESAFEGGLFL
ncbi:MAG: DUF4214 domain-containing protein [Pseudomonadota bacterium]